MWYFAWILGLGLAITFGVLNAIWYDIVEDEREAGTADTSTAAAVTPTAAAGTGTVRDMSS